MTNHHKKTKAERRAQAQEEKERHVERKLRGLAVSAPGEKEGEEKSRRARKAERRAEEEKKKAEKEKRKVEGALERAGRELKWEMGVQDDYGREKKAAAKVARETLGALGEDWKEKGGAAMSE